MSNATPASSVLYARLVAKARLRHLQLLVAVADSGSVRRAAEQIGMSQPAATQALADIEGLLAAPLFERHVRGMRLTAAGRAVVPMARNTLSALRASTDTVHALQAGAGGVLRVGAITAGVSGLLCRVLPSFAAHYPALRIEVLEAPGDQLLADVMSGRVDMALCRRPRELPAPCTFERLAPDVPWIAAGRRHPLVRKAQPTLADLRAARWMEPVQGIGVRSVFDALFDPPDAPRPELHPISTTSLPLVLELLRSHRVLTLVPRSVIAPFVEWGLVARVPYEFGGDFEGLGVLQSPENDSPAVAACLAALREAASQEAAAWTA
ncbi:LysR family transcriptional regulator [Variovorax sp. CAN2819]|uniref:LysR family transcriptional regulator n=1 Tax=Variovorax sp. CAN15 TaxID=3046727 RepID=UPI0026475CB8|nr:LysR family transcriptional regulator [Variovorax sp. CAN15]MDN6886340.1 LysR family transcriptional regulator [Variovorax sp. CAN15]